MNWNTCLAENPLKSNDYLKYFVLSVSAYYQHSFLKVYSSLSKGITLLMSTFKEFSSNPDGHTILSKLQSCLLPLFQSKSFNEWKFQDANHECDLSESSPKQLLGKIIKNGNNWNWWICWHNSHEIWVWFHVFWIALTNILKFPSYTTLFLLTKTNL